MTCSCGKTLKGNTNNGSISVNRDKDVNKNLPPAGLSSTETALIDLREGKNIIKLFALIRL